MSLAENIFISLAVQENGQHQASPSGVCGAENPTKQTTHCQKTLTFGGVPTQATHKYLTTGRKRKVNNKKNGVLSKPYFGSTPRSIPRSKSKVQKDYS